MYHGITEEQRVAYERVVRDLEERKIAQNLHYGIASYLVMHQATGHFLTRFFENDLFGAMSHADFASQKSLITMVRYIYSYADARSHGSKEKVKAWLDRSYLQPGEVERMENVCRV